MTLYLKKMQALLHSTLVMKFPNGPGPCCIWFTYDVKGTDTFLQWKKKKKKKTEAKEEVKGQLVSHNSFTSWLHRFMYKLNCHMCQVLLYLCPSFWPPKGHGFGLFDLVL